jgi:O-6-methylguanine DNA methyltransferase
VKSGSCADGRDEIGVFDVPWVRSGGGALRLVARWTGRGLASLAFVPNRNVRGRQEWRDDRGPASLALRTSPVPERLPDAAGSARARGLACALSRYFETGEWRFDIDLDLSGTPFQRLVWEALRRIPPGEVRTYGEVARAVGRPGAARAVGSACGANPVVIIVPCHRAVGADGLGGFGPGLDIKRRLLALEGMTFGAANGARAAKLAEEATSRVRVWRTGAASE